MSDPINTPAILEGFKKFYALPTDIQESATTAAVRLPINISGDDFRYVQFALADAIDGERKRVRAECMTPSIAISDVASLAVDLTNHLADYGEWCVGAGGQDTVDRIARFMTDWTWGQYHLQEAEYAREQAEFHHGIRWLADRAEPRLRGRHFRRIDP